MRSEVISSSIGAPAPLAVGVVALALLGCSSEPAPVTTPPQSTAPCAEPAAVGAPFGTQCGHLVDAEGRVRILRGVNARIEGIFDVTFDDGRVPLEEIPPFDAADAARMRAFGFDALRLPVNWSGLEPTEEGGFDAAYLGRVEAAVDAAHQAGLLVMLDLHQDAWGKDIGEDGAPLWATVPAPTQLLEGPLTDLEQRRLSQPVMDAFDTFFGDGADGERLRGRFIAMAAHLAARFAAHPAVLGLEIFNEPVSGAEGLARLYPPAYQAVSAAAPDKLFFFEPDVVRNFTDTAAIAEGSLGPRTVYAPHVYTLAFRNTPAQLEGMTPDTLRRSNVNARAEAESWAAPLVVGEWGFDPASEYAERYYRWQLELQDEVMASSFVWVWKERSQGSWGCFDHDPATDTWSPRPHMERWLARVRPLAVSGWPLEFSYREEDSRMQLRFQGDPTVTAPHLIRVPEFLGPPTRVLCDGDAEEAVEVEPGVFQVGCGAGTAEAHVLLVEVAPPL